MPGREDEKERRLEQLRSHAERWLHRQAAAAQALIPFDQQGLIHELHVHQVELEMQQEELLHSRAELEQSRNEYSILYHASPVAYFTLDPYGLVLQVNQRGSSLLGRDPGRLLQYPFRSLVVPSDRSNFDYFIKQVFTTESKQTCELSLTRLDGAPVMAHLEAQMVHTPAMPVRCLMAAIDITAKTETEQKLRQSEAALKTANEELEERVAERTRHLEQALEALQQQSSMFSKINQQLKQVNTDLDNFVYAASHDLKAPILNIEGLLSILLKALPPETLESERVQQIYAHMRDSVNRFKHTIYDLTQVSRLQSGEAEGESPVNLAEVLQEVTFDLAPLIEQTGARLTVALGDSPVVRCSRKNLRSVVYNLLSNALKYRSPHRPPEVHIRYEKTPEYAVLAVQDNGIGIQSKELGKVFRLFKRLHTHVEGTGVGLYIVKKIVRNAGGKIEVHSQPDKGSTFTLYFPD